MHALFYRIPNLKPSTERYAYLVMTASAIIALSAFMIYCGVGIHTLSLLSRLEKIIFLFCMKAELICQVGEWILFSVAAVSVIIASSLCVFLFIYHRNKPVVVVL